MVAIRTIHDRYPEWRKPVRVYFKASDGGWKTVGLDRVLTNDAR